LRAARTTGIRAYSASARARPRAEPLHSAGSSSEIETASDHRPLRTTWRALPLPAAVPRGSCGTRATSSAAGWVRPTKRLDQPFDIQDDVRIRPVEHDWCAGVEAESASSGPSPAPWPSRSATSSTARARDLESERAGVVEPLLFTGELSLRAEPGSTSWRQLVVHKARSASTRPSLRTSPVELPPVRERGGHARPVTAACSGSSRPGRSSTWSTTTTVERRPATVLSRPWSQSCGAETALHRCDSGRRTSWSLRSLRQRDDRQDRGGRRTRETRGGKTEDIRLSSLLPSGFLRASPRPAV